MLDRQCPAGRRRVVVLFSARGIVEVLVSMVAFGVYVVDAAGEAVVVAGIATPCLLKEVPARRTSHQTTPARPPPGAAPDAELVVDRRADDRRFGQHARRRKRYLALSWW